MAIAGWGTVDARACLSWCKQRRIPAFVMSETRAADGKRIWWKEWLKSLVVRKFDGALCGGESHKRYLVQLGIPPERIAFGYNVVDNEFFAKIRNAKWGIGNGGILTTEDTESTEGAAGLRLAGQAGASESDSLTSKLADSPVSESLTRSASDPDSSPTTRYSSLVTLPKAPYFLASNRFVGRKNLVRLIQAYSQYVASSKSDMWPLVLLGDGELRGGLETLAQKLELIIASADLKLNSYKLKTPSEDGLVFFAGFRQIEELPAFYSAAGAFVHPALEEPWGLVINEAMASGLPILSSRNVGATEELVVEGETGFLFDPMNVEEMAAALLRMADMPEARRREMGSAAQAMLERKAPKRAFGEGLKALLLLK
jgi:glycosyltransferase involved in cell wall biosynthesis